MTSSEDDAPLEDRLNSWSSRGISSILREAVASGPSGARLIAEQIDKRSGPDRVMLVAALGDADRSVGDESLRSLLESTNIDRDTKCAALLAITKRKGSKATNLMREKLDDPSRDVQVYAMSCLAYAGDGSAWDRAFDRWSQWIKRPTKRINSSAPDEAIGLAYLLQHLENSDAKLTKLRAALQKALPKLDDQVCKRIFSLWPQVSTETATSADSHPLTQVVHEWTNQRLGPLFDPLVL